MDSLTKSTKNGSLSLGWKVEFETQLQSFSSNHNDVITMEKDVMFAWRLTGFYGSLEEHNRKESWELRWRLGNGSNIP